MANNFKPWVDSPTAGQQVQSASVFATDAQRVDGFKAGDPASALRVNSALRQANIVVAGLMQMCDDIKTLPDGLSLMSTVTQVKNAIKAAIDQLDATVLASAKSYTDTRESVINGKLTDKQNQITSNKNRLDVLEPRVDDLEDEVAALNEGSSTLGQRVTTLESEMDIAQADITRLKRYYEVNVPNKLDKNLGAGLAGQYLVVGDNGDIITTDTIDGGGGGNIGSYWAMISNDSISTYYGNAYISFSFTTNNGYDESLIYAELKDILLASSVNIYRTQTDYANEYPEIDLGVLYSLIYNGDGLADGKQIIRGKATLADGGNTSYDCLLFVCEDAGGGNEKLELGIIDGDGHVRIIDDIRLDGTMSFFVAVFYLGGSY
jgi:hypothetical protein